MGRIALLQIEDKHLRGILADPRLQAAIPCLAIADQSLVAKLKTCGKCHRKKNTVVTDALIQARACLTSLPAPKRAELKRLLNANKIRITKRNSKGHKVVVTF